MGDIAQKHMGSQAKLLTNQNTADTHGKHNQLYRVSIIDYTLTTDSLGNVNCN